MDVFEASMIPGVIVRSQERAAVSTSSRYSSTSSYISVLPLLKEFILISVLIEAVKGENGLFDKLCNEDDMGGFSVSSAEEIGMSCK